MKMTQLLSGAAAIALVAGAANAQLADVGGAAGTDLSARQVAATEFTGSIADNLILTFNAGADPFATVGVGEAVEFNVTLTNAVFSVAVPAAAWDTDATNEAPNTSTCDFGNVSAGGGLGQSTVSWTRTVAAPNECTQALFNGDVADLNIAIERADASLPVTVTYGFRPVATANFTADTQTETLLVNANAYDPSASAGTTAANLLSADGTAAAGGFTGVLGSITGGFSATTGAIITTAEGVDIAAGANIVNDADADADLDTTAAGNGIAGVGDIVAVVQFADLTGIAAVTLDSDACDLDTTANTATCDDLTPAEFDGTARNIAFTLTPGLTDVVAPQTPTVAVTVNDQNNWDIAGISSTALAEISWDDGVSDQVLDGPGGVNDANTFPWTNLRASGGTQSNFRVTGLGTDLAQDSDECIQFQLTAAAGDALPSAYVPGSWVCLNSADVTVSADASLANRWSAIFNSTAIANALGVTTEGLNANVSFRARVADSGFANTADAAIDRLLIKNGIVTGTGFDG